MFRTRCFPGLKENFYLLLSMLVLRHVVMLIIRTLVVFVCLGRQKSTTYLYQNYAPVLILRQIFQSLFQSNIGRAISTMQSSPLTVCHQYIYVFVKTLCVERCLSYRLISGEFTALPVGEAIFIVFKHTRQSYTYIL